MDCFDYIQTVLSGITNDNAPVTSVQFTMVSNQASGDNSSGLPPDPIYGAVCSYAWGLLGPNNDMTEISGSAVQYFSYRESNTVAASPPVFDPNQTDQLGIDIKIDYSLRIVTIIFTLMSWGNTTFTLSDLQCDSGVMTGIGPSIGNRPFEANSQVSGVSNALYIISLGLFIETD